MATTTQDVLTRTAGMWLTPGETHELLGLIAYHNPDAMMDALDRLDRIRAARQTATTLKV